MSSWGSSWGTSWGGSWGATGSSSVVGTVQVMRVTSYSAKTVVDSK